MTLHAAKAERPWSVQWLLACTIPAIFVATLFAITIFAAPEHDDFCFALSTARDGAWSTIIAFYEQLTGRILALAIIDLPHVVASVTGLNLLASYSLVLAICSIAFVLGCIAAVFRVWPRSPLPQKLFMSFVFVAASFACAPSPHELLYWLPGLACYGTAAVLSILVLAECVRAVGQADGFSSWTTVWMIAGGFAAAMCNEFTGPWIILILTTSLLARIVWHQDRQTFRHFLIGGATLAGFIIVAMAPGNAARADAMHGRYGHIAPSVFEALRFSIHGLKIFVSTPVVMTCLLAAVIVPLYEAPSKVEPARNRAIAAGVVIICLSCCFFEYFAHEYSTGGHLVERAQNQALIMLLFGFSLSISMVVRSYPPSKLFAGSKLPLALAAVVAAALFFSPTGRMLRQDGESLYPFWLESIERDQKLRSSEPIVTISKRRLKPTLLMGSDITESLACTEGFYQKKIIVAEP